MSILHKGKEMVQLNCWHCQKKTETRSFCEHCGKVQAVSLDEDYFSFLGFPRLLSINPQDLEKAFHELSRRFHPDFFHGSIDNEKKLSLENSVFLNKAYRTLKDPIERAEYFLTLEGEPPSKNQKQPPADLFEEIFEIQELIEDFRKSKDEPDSLDSALKENLEKEKRDLEGRRGELEKELVGLFQKWDLFHKGSLKEERIEEKKKIFKEIRDILYNRSYLNTVIRDIGKALET
jgi:molecular chaperone HscB